MVRNFLTSRAKTKNFSRLVFTIHARAFFQT
ncbi:DUF1661 domain-containing protein [Porphyromonas gingivalis]|nr:DUF1661 domain-containing protein [Porphyromonas gingivalis]MCE8180314.1 DUF1661 domain-containing protein [Porphyromonas gingivalis]